MIMINFKKMLLISTIFTSLALSTKVNAASSIEYIFDSTVRSASSLGGATPPYLWIRRGD
jgi:hypothetical protein